MILQFVHLYTIVEAHCWFKALRNELAETPNQNEKYHYVLTFLQEKRLGLSGQMYIVVLPVQQNSKILDSESKKHNNLVKPLSVASASVTDEVNLSMFKPHSLCGVTINK